MEEPLAPGLSYYKAYYYLFPSGIIPTADICVIENYDPIRVPYEPGAVGFEFVKIVEVEMDDGETSKFVINRNEYYYWGQLILIEELANSSRLEKIMDSTDSESFCLTSFGGLIPLDDEDNVIPYPNALEIPIDMRLE